MTTLPATEFCPTLRLADGYVSAARAWRWVMDWVRCWKPTSLRQMSLWPGFADSGGSAEEWTVRGLPVPWANRGELGGGGGGLEPSGAGAGDGGLPFYHEPVLMREVIEFLQPSAGKLFLDVTLGGGGHSEALLEHGASVVAMDQDPVAIAHATSRLRAHASRFCALRGNFRRFPELLAEIGIKKLDGILADIGVSSRQLDDPLKGFSFMHEGPLDLRMNPDAPVTAADLINGSSQGELERIFIDYGEEPHARRIARAILAARAVKRIETTLELARVIEGVVPRKNHRHPATLVFQALRIAVNDELAALQDLLAVAPLWLKPGGRLVIISFHSLEDRLVKKSFIHHSAPMLDRVEWPEPRPNPDFCLEVLTRKPVEPSAEEVERNPRSRSSRLRAAQRLPEP